MPPSKFLVSADWHADCPKGHGSHGGINDRLLDFTDALRELISYARGQKIKTIYVLGDVFHLKKNIPEQARNQVFSYLWHARDLDWVFVAGNHDREDDRFDSVTIWPFRAFGDVYIEPAERDGIAFIPWMYDQARQIKAFKAISKKADILMFHGELDGAETGPMDFALPSKVDERVIKPDRFEHVFAGHIHKRQHTKGVWYPGSLIATNFGERELDKGFLVVDGSRVKIVPVKYPKFVNLRLTDEQCRDVAEFSAYAGNVFTGNFVRLSVPQALDQAILKILEQANPRSLDVIPERTPALAQGKPVEVRSLKDLVARYVEIKGIPSELQEEYIAYAHEILAT